MIISSTSHDSGLFDFVKKVKNMIGDCHLVWRSGGGDGEKERKSLWVIILSESWTHCGVLQVLDVLKSQ